MKNNFTEFVLRHFGIFLYFTLSNIFCLALFAIKNKNQAIFLALKEIKSSVVSLVFTTLFIFLFIFILKKMNKKIPFGGGGIKAFNIY